MIYIQVTTEVTNYLGESWLRSSISKQQKRPIAKPLSEIAAQHKDRKTAVIAAYKTGACSQREIGEYYQLHPTRLGLFFARTRILDSGPEHLSRYQYPIASIEINIKFAIALSYGETATGNNCAVLVDRD